MYLICLGVKKLKRFKKIFLFLILIAVVSTSQFSVYASEERLYYLGGFPVGFDLSGKGALVVGLSEVICEDDIYLPAKDAGIKSGDYILSLNGKEIKTASDIDEVLQKYTEGCVIAEILSNNKKSIVNIYPKKDLTGIYKIGVLIRDYISGIGTVTIINEQGEFISLGHSIIDEEGTLLSVGDGKAFSCDIVGIKKGERGIAGELKGNILRGKNLGCVYLNSYVGLVGKFYDLNNLPQKTKLPLGEPSLGNAQIYTTINGNLPESYSISIIKIDNNAKNNKNMVIKITDEKLVKCTGGIVQGMSGSPIIQNGKIVGAVTHVFLNDSTRGFAININKMAKEIE